MNKLVLIGGEERPIAFGMNFHREFERVTGLSFLNRDDQNKLSSYTAIIGVVYSALKWGKWNGEAQEPSFKFSMSQVSEWLDKNPEAKGIILDAMRDSMPKDEPKNEGAAENAA